MVFTQFLIILSYTQEACCCLGNVLLEILPTNPQLQMLTPCAHKCPPPKAFNLEQNLSLSSARRGNPLDSVESKKDFNKEQLLTLKKPEELGVFWAREQRQRREGESKRDTSQGPQTNPNPLNMLPASLHLGEFIHPNPRKVSNGQGSNGSPQGIFRTKKIPRAACFLNHTWG